MNTSDSEQHRHAERRLQLRNSLNQYARLLLKSNGGSLLQDELSVMFLTAARMRKGAWELGVTNRQLEQMLERTVQRLDISSHTRTSL